MLLHRMLVDGAILSALATGLILGSVRANPRLWLQDFPADIRDAVPPKTPAEKRQSLIWGIPLLATFLGIPLLSCLWLARQTGTASFGLLWLDAFGVLMIFNAFDLLVIDWVVVCWLTPSFLVIPGTEGFAGYKNYWHHFRGFLIGTAGLASVATIVATVVWFVNLRTAAP
jgi:hypothetical protein